MVFGSVAQIYIGEITLFQEDDRIGKFLFYQGQGQSCEGEALRVPFDYVLIMWLNMLKDIGKIAEGKCHHFLIVLFP